MKFSHFSQNEAWIGNSSLIIITLVNISIADIAKQYARPRVSNIIIINIIIDTNSSTEVHNHPIGCAWSIVKVSILRETGLLKVWLTLEPS